MSSTFKVNHYSDYQVRSSQPGIEDAMNLVRANALPTGASLDRMHLKVSAGSLAGRCLLWDQPSMSWVDMTEFTESQMGRYDEQDDWTGDEDERPETAPETPLSPVDHVCVPAAIAANAAAIAKAEGVR